MGDFRVLLIEDEEVPGALRGTARHEIQEAFHRGVVLNHGLSLGIDPGPNVLTLRLFHGGIFFLGQPGLLRLELLLCPADQVG